MEKMRAVVYDRYGAPEVLRVADVPKPEMEPGYVMVSVKAVSVNGGETFTRAGKFRLLTGGRFPKGIGADFAGVVTEVGVGVGDVAVGDHVWGVMPRDQYARGKRGSLAEYVCVPRRQIAHSPSGLDFGQAAALIVSATSLLALREHAHLQRGERLLVRGATGGVGIPGVEIGKSMGAYVVGLASKSNLDFARELGTDEAFDYRATVPEELGRFDVILDTVGNELPRYRRLLSPGGRMVAVAINPDALKSTAAAVLASFVHGSRRIRFFSAAPRTELLTDLAGLVDKRALKPHVDTTYSMEEIVEAHKAIESGGGRGKRIILLE